MGMMGEVPSSERLQIGFFGKRNAGKSSLVNTITGQQLAVVSDTPGTTTDPVKKAMEIAPLGPVVIIDTPGWDDEGDLGSLRVEKTREILRRVDLAVLVVDGTSGLQGSDKELIGLFQKRGIPYLVVYSKADLMMNHSGQSCRKSTGDLSGQVQSYGESHFASLAVSARRGDGIRELKDLLGRLGKGKVASAGLLDDLIQPGDLFVLVIPQDASAPKGRLILPEQMTIHEILDHGGEALCCQPDRLGETLNFLGRSGKEIRMVITDSQAFRKVADLVPEAVPLASFSILMARYKGVLDEAVRGVKAIDRLQDGDRILMAEGCTHHRQCADIGTVKIPAWLRTYTGRRIEIETSSGFSFPQDLTPYHMVIHCGGCMLNEREVQDRMRQAKNQEVPFANYGMVIAYMNGILERSLKAIGRTLEE